MLLFDKLTFPAEPLREVPLAGASVKLKPNQAVVWISLQPPILQLPDRERDSLPSDVRRLPAVLDTGNNLTVSLRESHLDDKEWSRYNWQFNPDRPRKVQDASGRTNLTATLLADVWLLAESRHAGAPEAYRIPLGNIGVGVYPNNGLEVDRHITQARWDAFLSEQRKANSSFVPVPAVGPPLPLLGLAALSQGRIKIQLQCDPKAVTVSLWLPLSAAEA